MQRKCSGISKFQSKNPIKLTETFVMRKMSFPMTNISKNNTPTEKNLYQNVSCLIGYRMTDACFTILNHKSCKR